MLEEIKLSYHVCASGLGDYSKLSKQELANGYIEADKNNDSDKRDQYFSALVIRYWFKIGKYYQESKTAFSMEDCYEWLLHALLYALEHHPWLIEGNALYGDPNGADKTINRCIISTRLIAYQHANTDRSRITHSATSLDSMVESLGDSLYDNPELLEEDLISHSNSIVKMFLDDNKVLEAFIVDGICNQNVFREDETKEVVPEKSYIIYDEDDNPVTVKEEAYSIKKVNYSFNSKKLVKHLSNMDSNFLSYFSQTYGINKEILETEAQKLCKLNSTKLNKIVANAMNELKNNQEFKEMLCS